LAFAIRRVALGSLVERPLAFGPSPLYRDAPLLCIGEGTSEMQRIIFARHLIRRNRA
jgi:alkylation response protein AidB-like acyl-CoA dehydrogenase